jgi:Class II flagellar assembly regulator
MRVNGPNGTAAIASAPTARRSSSGTFSLSEGEASRPSSSASSLRTIGGIDALIALQGIEDPTERRRRALARGRTALDALDELKIGLLSGSLDSATLGRLKSAASGLKDGSGDSRLDGVLSEIELRVEVEIAKMGAS